jgi:hypothetical protein
LASSVIVARSVQSAVLGIAPKIVFGGCEITLADHAVDMEIPMAAQGFARNCNGRQQDQRGRTSFRVPQTRASLLLVRLYGTIRPAAGRAR